MKPSDLRIQIASPCDQRWEQMTGDANVRHCDSCNKNVYNLSAMTISEIDAMVSRTGNSFCRKYFLRRDGTIIVDDCPVGLRAIRARMAKVMFAFVSLVGGLLALKEPHKLANGLAIGVDATRLGKSKVVRSLVDAFRLQVDAAAPDKRSARAFPFIGLEPLIQTENASREGMKKHGYANDGAITWPNVGIGTLNIDREYDPHTHFGGGILINEPDQSLDQPIVGYVW